MNPANPTTGNGTAWKAVVVERSPDSQAAMIRQLEARGFDVAATLDRANNAAVEVRAHKADLLILEIDQSPESVLTNIEQLATEFRGLRVIVTAPAAEPDLILKVLRAGATEFLVRPVSSDEFGRALDRVLRSLGPAATTNGQVFAVYSPKGGIGNTTIAVNTAFALSRNHGNSRIALVDTVLHGGDVQVFLDLSPSYTISDLLEKTERIDQQLLEKVLYKHPGGVWVLPEPGQPEEAEELRGRELTAVVSRLRTGFDYVVVDCEHQLNDRTLTLLDMADKILVIAVLNVPAVRQLQRTLEVFQRLGYPEHKIRLVVNRHHPKDVLNVKDIEKALERSVMWRLPNDYKATIDAITRGKPLASTAPRSKLTESFDGLAAELTDSEAPTVPLGDNGLGARMRHIFLKAKGQ